MKPDIVDAIVALKPGAEWNLRGDDYSGLEWLDKSQTKPTEDEVNTKVTELVNAYPMKLLRDERTRRIATSDWMANSDVTISDEWKTYRQALRDLPATSTPKLNNQEQLDESSVTWPTPPS
tara:strand:- start:60 stop:422 length:363 start_codon:yes stop_codon:yes gene_type:complete